MPDDSIVRTVVPLIERKSGAIQLNESSMDAIDNLVAAFPFQNEKDCAAISRGYKAVLRADSSGNWELSLLTDAASLASKIVRS